MSAALYHANVTQGTAPHTQKLTHSSLIEKLMPEITLPDVEINLFTPKNPTTAKIIENYICTEESSPNVIRHITIDLEGSGLEGVFRSGQSIGILPPGENEKGKPHKLRLYSVSSPSKGEGGNPNYDSTTVKRANEEVDGVFYTGICSNYLSNLKPGDELSITGPSGKRYLLPSNADEFNYVFFATGTGVAPFRGMIMELIEAGHKGQIVLIFGCPYRTDLLYKSYFESLEKEYDNVHYIKMISREDRRSDGSKKYVQTAIEDYDELLAPILASDNTLVYLCGMKGMQTGIYEQLAKKGYTDYLTAKGEAAEKDPSEWTWEDLKTSVKPSDRTFEEVS